MNGIDKSAEAIKNKLRINDYNTESLQNSKTAKKKISKTKVSLYLTDEAMKKFDEIYARRILAGNKTDRSDIISEMIMAFRE